MIYLKQHSIFENNLNSHRSSFDHILKLASRIEVLSDAPDATFSVYDSEDFIIDSEDIVTATKDDDPPVVVNIKRKRVVKPCYGGVLTDDLGYLSHYVIEMACKDKLQIIKDDDKARKKLQAEIHRRDSCESSCPCELSVPDLTDNPVYKKSVHFVGSIPTNIPDPRLRDSFDSSRLSTC